MLRIKKKYISFILLLILVITIFAIFRNIFLMDPKNKTAENKIITENSNDYKVTNLGEAKKLAEEVFANESIYIEAEKSTDGFIIYLKDKNTNKLLNTYEIIKNTNKFIPLVSIGID